MEKTLSYQELESACIPKLCSCLIFQAASEGFKGLLIGRRPKTEAEVAEEQAVVEKYYRTLKDKNRARNLLGSQLDIRFWNSEQPFIGLADLDYVWSNSHLSMAAPTALRTPILDWFLSQAGIVSLDENQTNHIAFSFGLEVKSGDPIILETHIVKMPCYEGVAIWVPLSEATAKLLRANDQLPTALVADMSKEAS